MMCVYACSFVGGTQKPLDYLPMLLVRPKKEVPLLGGRGDDGLEDCQFLPIAVFPFHSMA
jgi:hypothetical protein